MSTHVLYTASDFNQEEIERENILAVYVIDQGLDICKVCGKVEIELQWDCDTVMSYQGCREDLSDEERDRNEEFCLPCCMDAMMDVIPFWAGLGWVRYL